MKFLLRIQLVLAFGVITQQLKAQAWEAVGPDDIDIMTFTSYESQLFAGSEGNTGGVYETTTNGDHWIQRNVGLPMDQTKINRIETVGNILLAAATFRGIYQSLDSAKTWTLHIGQPGLLIGVRDIINLLDDYNVIIAGGHKIKGKSGAAISENGGPWVDFSNGLPLSGQLHEFLRVDSFLYSGNAVGLYRHNLNNGVQTASWSSVNLNENITAMHYHNGFLFAGTDGGGLFRSVDGLQWETINDDLVVLLEVFTDFASYGSHLFVGTTGSNPAVYHSTNGGETWDAITDGLPSSADITDLIIHDGYLFAGTEALGVYRLSLSGIVSVDNISDSPLQTIQITPNPGDGLFKISLDHAYKADKVEVTCLSPDGKIILQKIVKDEGDLLLDLTQVTAGVYFVKLSLDGEVVTKKVVVQ